MSVLLSRLDLSCGQSILTTADGDLDYAVRVSRTEQGLEVYIPARNRRGEERDGLRLVVEPYGVVRQVSGKVWCER